MGVGYQGSAGLTAGSIAGLPSGSPSTDDLVPYVHVTAATFARGRYTFDDVPVDGDTVSFNGVEFVFKDTPVEDNEIEIASGIPIGDDTLLGQTIDNLRIALDASTDPLLTIAVYDDNRSAPGTKDATAILADAAEAGAAGNAYTLDSEDTANMTRSAATLTDGADEIQELRQTATDSFGSGGGEFTAVAIDALDEETPAAGAIVPFVKPPISRVVRGTATNQGTVGTQRIIRGTCSDAGTDGSTITLGNTSFPVHSSGGGDYAYTGTNATEYATEIVNEINNAGAGHDVEDIPAVLALDNGNGTFNIYCHQGTAANALEFSTDDPNLTFEELVAGLDDAPTVTLGGLTGSPGEDIDGGADQFEYAANLVTWAKANFASIPVASADDIVDNEDATFDITLPPGANDDVFDTTDNNLSFSDETAGVAAVLKKTDFPSGGGTTTVADAAARLALADVIGQEAYQSDNGFFYKQIAADSSQAGSWQRQPVSVALETNFSKDNNTYAAAPDFEVTLEAGKRYRITLDGIAQELAKINFSGGTATATRMMGEMYGLHCDDGEIAGYAAVYSLGSETVTGRAGDLWGFHANFVIDVSSGGTLAPQFGQPVTDAGTPLVIQALAALTATEIPIPA